MRLVRHFEQVTVVGYGPPHNDYPERVNGRGKVVILKSMSKLNFSACD